MVCSALFSAEPNLENLEHLSALPAGHAAFKSQIFDPVSPNWTFCSRFLAKPKQFSTSPLCLISTRSFSKLLHHTDRTSSRTGFHNSDTIKRRGSGSCFLFPQKEGVTKQTCVCSSHSSHRTRDPRVFKGWRHRLS